MTDRRYSLYVLPDTDELARSAADEILRAAQTAGDHFTLALSGGATPKPLYQRLASSDYAARLDWQRIHIFWGDERCVPPDDPNSNYRMAQEALLDHVPLPPENIHRIPGELPPDEAITFYDRELRAFFGGLPRFDLILLGIGTDGHTTSLFPHSPALHEHDRYLAATRAPTPPVDRVTLTLPVINNAARVLFVVSGAHKAEMLRRVLYDDRTPDALPAQAVQPTDGKMLWLVDAAAAQSLPR